MKQKTKTFFYGILAVFTFSLVLGACPSDSGTPPPDRSKLKLSGQVYIQSTDYSTILSKPNEKYTKDLDIYDGGLGGTGEIKKGMLAYSIDVVPPLSPINEGGSLDYLKNMYESLKFSPEDASVAAVALEITGSEEYGGVLKGLLGLDMSQLPIKLTIKTLNYVYVDKDLKITADKKTFNYNDFDFSNGFDFPISLSLTSEKINLPLKKGWNSLYSEITVDLTRELIALIMSQNLSILDLMDLQLIGNLKMSVGDPGKLNWTLIPSLPPDIIDLQYPEDPDL